jgi:hypothetical protein
MEPSFATEEAAMSSARDQVYGALGSDDPTTALRAASIDIAARLGRSCVETIFASVCEELAEAGRDEESELVAFVLEMIAEW